MKVRDWYKEAMIGKHHSLQLLIEFLVYEKNAIKFEDDEEKLSYYLQDRFSNKMNQYLSEYKEKRNANTRAV